MSTRLRIAAITVAIAFAVVCVATAVMTTSPSSVEAVSRVVALPSPAASTATSDPSASTSAVASPDPALAEALAPRSAAPVDVAQEEKRGEVLQRQAASARVGDGAAVTQVSAASIGLDAGVDRYTNDQVEKEGGVDPVSMDRAAWWSGAGSPSTNPGNTTYVYGHTWYRPAVFNRLKELKAGDDITLSAGGSEFHYAVTEQFVVSKAGLTSDPRVTSGSPGRLLLIGCYRERGDEKTTTENVVVVAQRV